jgi:hypothetical protein
MGVTPNSALLCHESAIVSKTWLLGAESAMSRCPVGTYIIGLMLYFANPMSGRIYSTHKCRLTSSLLTFDIIRQCPWAKSPRMPGKPITKFTNFNERFKVVGSRMTDLFSFATLSHGGSNVRKAQVKQNQDHYRGQPFANVLQGERNSSSADCWRMIQRVGSNDDRQIAKHEPVEGR